MMTTSRRVLARTVAAGALFSLVALHGANAEARWRRHGGHFPGLFGAAVAGVVIGAALAPPVEARVYYGPPPPPQYPPPAYYAPPPPAYYAPPPAAVYAPAPVEYQRAEFPRLGLGVMGTVQAGHHDSDPMGGVTGILAVRTSSHSQLSFELQSVGGRTPDDGRRNDLSALLGGRVFFWDAALAPYLELGAGAGRTVIASDGFYRYRDTASQMLGRFGLGLELRLGQHLVLDGQIAQLHRWRMDDSGLHERATELRAGIGFRF
jgi:hypothetical protein